jgi:hypothetical protein
MSVHAINAVFSRSKSHGVARLVLLAIADRADETGRAYPGTTDICRRTNCSRRAVISARPELVALGELVVERGGGSSEAGRLSNRYWVNLPPVQPVHQCGDSTSADHAETGAPPAPEPVQTPHPNHQKPSKNHHGAKLDRFDAGSVELPFSSEAFSEAWETWIRHRKEKRQKLTPTATRLQLSKLLTMGEARAIAAIEHSISGNYQGIFEARTATTERPRFSPIGEPLNEAARRQVASKPKFSLT